MIERSVKVESCFLPSFESESLIRTYLSRLAEEAARIYPGAEGLREASAPYLSWLLSTRPTDISPELIAAENRSYRDGKVPRDLATPPWAEYFFSEDKIIGTNGQQAKCDHRPYEATQPPFAQADQILQRIWPEAHREFDRAISRFYFYNGEPGSGGSSARTFGALFLATHNTHRVEYANSIIHETAHHLLNLLRFYDPIFTSSYNEPCVSGLRATKRPAWRVVHAAFSMHRMIHWLRLVESTCEGEDVKEAKRLLDNFFPKQVKTLYGIAHLSWTPSGAELYRQMCDQCGIQPAAISA